MRRSALLALTASVIGIVLAVSGAFAWVGSDPEAPPPPVTGMDPAALATANDLDAVVASLQDRLHTQPADAPAWATLGVAYVEQARLTGDPTYYPKAAGALRRSLAEQPDDNAPALAGRAALAAARHQFGRALQASRAALRINPYELGALAVRVDALTELGRYSMALDALAQADRRRPGLPVFARYSYARELHGRTGEAAELLRRALSSASAPADRAYLLTLLADLDRQAGRLGVAGAALSAALRSDPGNLAAQASQARLAVARGELDQAARRWRDLVSAAPLPEYVLALGELYDATGRDAAARAQYRVLEATARVARSSGVDTALETAHYQADHGSAAKALTAARAAYGSASSIWAADALAWALHRSGRDRAALQLAREATRLGTPDALLWIHRGGIEAALGDEVSAARHLRRGLSYDPGLSVWQARQARRVLAAVTR